MLELGDRGREKDCGGSGVEEGVSLCRDCGGDVRFSSTCDEKLVDVILSFYLSSSVPSFRK